MSAPLIAALFFTVALLVVSAARQDELYVVVRGHGTLFHDGKKETFGPGDAMFVAAGTAHHFESFNDDLAVWVAFYGQQGGEA